MSRFLFIAVYGSTLAIALAFILADYGDEKNIAASKESTHDFEPELEDVSRDFNWNAEDDDLDNNEPEAGIDDEKEDNEGEESDIFLSLPKRSTDLESKKSRTSKPPSHRSELQTTAVRPRFRRRNKRIPSR